MAEGKNVSNPMGMWVAVGLAIGAGVGVAIRNIGLGIGLGILFGAAIGAVKQRKSSKDGASRPKPSEEDPS